MKKVSIIGLFCNGLDVADGQSIKTRIVADELERALGREQIARVDTYGWKKHPFRLFARCIASVRDSRHVIFMTDSGGIRIFPWLLRCANVFHHRSLHYVVIGGWLVPYLKEHPLLAGCIKALDTVFAETLDMQAGLEGLGFTNVCLMPNFKALTPLAEEQLVYHHREPYAFCTFSRVIQEKGIADAVEAVRTVNERFGRTVCTLDIYGATDPRQAQWFRDLQDAFPPEVRYCGVVPFDSSVDVLKDYFALLFPTLFPTEGVPGTVIDAYAAGLPVIASRWGAFEDIVDEGITGIGYPCLHNELLTDILAGVIANPRIILDMKKNCLQKAASFSPEQVADILLKKLV